MLDPAEKLAGGRARRVGAAPTVRHLGWVHQHEARPVGEPRERMGGRRERRMTAEIGAGLVGKDVVPKGGWSLGTLDGIY